MYYDPNYINWGRQGWTCPKCQRVYSPDTPQCWYCNGGTKTMPSTTATPEWIYKEDTTTGVVKDLFNKYCKTVSTAPIKSSVLDSIEIDTLDSFMKHVKDIL